MKLSNKFKNNFWVLNYKPIGLIILTVLFILFCANLLLNLIDFLTSKF